jgi:hypothetical protein
VVGAAASVKRRSALCGPDALTLPKVLALLSVAMQRRDGNLFSIDLILVARALKAVR